MSTGKVADQDNALPKYTCTHTFQEMNINTLCLSITNTADERCPELLSRAESTSKKFRTALTLFEKCHRGYSSSHHMSDTDIPVKVNGIYSTQTIPCMYMYMFTLSESNIEEFLQFFRSTFPSATISPKLHLMEDYIVPFIRRWRVGFGLMEEQGAESIHTVYNHLKRRYATIQSKQKHLFHITLEHHRKNCPVLQSYNRES